MVFSQSTKAGLVHYNNKISLQGSSSGKTSELLFSAWAFLSTIVFGIILIFYVDNIAEERFSKALPFHNL